MSQEPEVVNSWDNIIVQINQGDEKVGAIRMQKQDMDNMISFHGSNRQDVLELLLKTLETTPKEDISK